MGRLTLNLTCPGRLALNLASLDLVTLTLPYMDMSRVYHVTYDVIKLNMMFIIEYYAHN